MISWDVYFSNLVCPVSLVFGVLYWAVLTVFWPWLRGYQLEEATEVLPDGTTVTKLIRAPRDG